MAWRGFDPTAKGRHWVTGIEKLDEMDANGEIHWTRTGAPRRKKYLEPTGKPLQDVWTDVAPINSQAQERLGYPTQKPIALLERIIGSSSNPGDVVLGHWQLRNRRARSPKARPRMDRHRHYAPGGWPDPAPPDRSVPPRQLRRVRGPEGRRGGRGAALALPTTSTSSNSGRSSMVRGPGGAARRGPTAGWTGYIFFKPDGKRIEKAIVSVKGSAHVSEHDGEATSSPRSRT